MKRADADMAQVYEAAINAGAEDIQRAEAEDGVLDGYKACHTPA